MSNGGYPSIGRSKKILFKEVCRDHKQTFYCNSEFNLNQQVFHTNGYIPIGNDKRANRLEWEHVVPVHVFGQSFREWREGDPACIDSKGQSYKGHKCVEKINIQFRHMQADMHNLVPVIGELSRLRSNDPFAIIQGEERRFGSCDMEIANRKVEPPENVRGNIARIYFYMNDTYSGRGVVSEKNRKLFDAWDKQDPVDKWECEKERRIRELQGRENFFVSRRCLGGYGGGFWLPL